MIWSKALSMEKISLNILLHFFLYLSSFRLKTLDFELFLNTYVKYTNIVFHYKKYLKLYKSFFFLILKF